MCIRVASISGDSLTEFNRVFATVFSNGDITPLNATRQGARPSGHPLPTVHVAMRPGKNSAARVTDSEDT